MIEWHTQRESEAQQIREREIWSKSTKGAKFLHINCDTICHYIRWIWCCCCFFRCCCCCCCVQPEFPCTKNSVVPERIQAITLCQVLSFVHSQCLVLQFIVRWFHGYCSTLFLYAFFFLSISQSFFRHSFFFLNVFATIYYKFNHNDDGTFCVHRCHCSDLLYFLAIIFFLILFVVFLWITHSRSQHLLLELQFNRRTIKREKWREKKIGTTIRSWKMKNNLISCIKRQQKWTVSMSEKRRTNQKVRQFDERKTEKNLLVEWRPEQERRSGKNGKLRFILMEI